MDSKRLLTKTSNRNPDFTQSIEDDPLIDGPLISRNALEAAIKREFRKVPTTWGAVLLSVLHVAFVCMCVALAAVCWLTDAHTADCTAVLNGVDSRTLVLLSKVGLWLLVFVFERYVQYQHSAVRRRGYLQFYRTTAKLKHLPLLVHSAGNAAVLIVIAPSSMLDDKVKNLSVFLLLVIICLELLASVMCLVLYAVHVLRFNRQSPSPDVTEEERSRTYSPTLGDAHTEMGFSISIGGAQHTATNTHPNAPSGHAEGDSSCLEDVVEKQADLIEYLKQHNAQLSKRILTLTSQQTRD